MGRAAPRSRNAHARDSPRSTSKSRTCVARDDRGSARLPPCPRPDAARVDLLRAASAAPAPCANVGAARSVSPRHHAGDVRGREESRDAAAKISESKCLTPPAYTQTRHAAKPRHRGQQGRGAPCPSRPFSPPRPADFSPRSELSHLGRSNQYETHGQRHVRAAPWATADAINHEPHEPSSIPARPVCDSPDHNQSD